VLVAKRAERALVALVLDAEVPELARAVMLARRPQERRVYAADGEETVHVRGGHLRQGARHARLILRGIHVTHGAECTGAVVEAQLHFVRLAHGAASGGFKTVVSGKAKTVALALHGCQSAHHGGVLSGKHRVCLAVGMRCGRGGTYAIRVVVGAGCVVISGLRKPASVPEPGVTLPQQTRYAVSPQKGSKAVTMPHFFGPVGSTASGAGKGLVTRIKKSYMQMEGIR